MTLWQNPNAFPAGTKLTLAGETYEVVTIEKMVKVDPMGTGIPVWKKLTRHEWKKIDD